MNEPLFEELGNEILNRIDDVVYAGVVGSILCRNDAKDIDISVVVEDNQVPMFMHIKDNISALAFDCSWMTYQKHMENPTGLIPSILFKSIELSPPVVGNKKSIKVPKIQVCDADYINLEIKRIRFSISNRKNYLIALIFEQLLKTSSDLEKYHFDNITLARELGLSDIAEELEKYYLKKGTAEKWQVEGTKCLANGDKQYEFVGRRI